MEGISLESKLFKLHDEARQNIELGNIKKAQRIVKKIKSFGSSPIVSLVISGLIIDIGSIQQNENFVKEGVRILKSDIGKIIKKIRIYAPSALYNLGNGYSALFYFRRKNNNCYSLFKNTENEYAKRYYLKALEYKINNPTLISQIWTNLGNCYDHSGRVFDALDCYDQALVFKPDHGMALGNKGLGLYYYAALTPQYQPTILKEAYLLIKQALKFGVNPEEVKGFKHYLQRIENSIPDKKFLIKKSEYPGIQIKARTKFERFLNEFCLKNKLYLNICNFCQKCNNAIGDPDSIEQMIVSLEKKDAENFVKKDQYLRLSSYLNQIKQDYITARFLLILSRYEGRNLSFVDKGVRLIDTLDYKCHNIYVELVKASFVYFYNILDKIAFFIKDYLKFKHRSDFLNFSTIWFDLPERKVKKEIRNTKNFSLNALFNIYTDLEKGPQQKLKNIRNKLTHSFLNIYHSIGIIDDKNMTEETLVEDTIELARLVRNSIMYLLKFIFIKESEKKDGLDKEILTMPAFEIPDNLKSYR